MSTHSPCPPFLKPPICSRDLGIIKGDPFFSCDTGKKVGLSYAGQLGLINETSLNRTLLEVGCLSYHDSLDGIEPSAVKAHCSWVISTSDLANLNFHFEGQKKEKNENKQTNRQLDKKKKCMSKETNQESKKNKNSIRPEQESKKQIRKKEII